MSAHTGLLTDREVAGVGVLKFIKEKREAILRLAHPEVPWAQVVAMRNVLLHDYLGIDPEEAWSAVTRDRPVPKPKTQGVLQELSAARDG